jgi:hypothetical protein
MTLNIAEALAVIRQTKRVVGRTEIFFDSLSSLPPGTLAQIVEPSMRLREKLEFAVEEFMSAFEQAQGAAADSQSGSPSPEPTHI